MGSTSHIEQAHNRDAYDNSTWHAINTGYINSPKETFCLRFLLYFIIYISIYAAAPWNGLEPTKIQSFSVCSVITWNNIKTHKKLKVLALFSRTGQHNVHIFGTIWLLVLQSDTRKDRQIFYKETVTIKMCDLIFTPTCRRPYLIFISTCRRPYANCHGPDSERSTQRKYDIDWFDLIIFIDCFKSSKP